MKLKSALAFALLSTALVAACAPTPRESISPGSGTDAGGAQGGSGGSKVGGAGGAGVDGGTGSSTGGTDGSVGTFDAPVDGAAGGAAGGMNAGGMNAGGTAGMNAGGMAGMNAGGMAGGAPTTDVCRLVDENENMDVACPAGNVIKEITFASYGTVSGACPTPALGTCNSTTSGAVVAQKCVGKNQCTVFAGNGEFGGDPCPMVRKKLGVIAKCGM